MKSWTAAPEVEQLGPEAALSVRGSGTLVPIPWAAAQFEPAAVEERLERSAAAVAVPIAHLAEAPLAEAAAGPTRPVAAVDKFVADLCLCARVPG